MKKTKLTLLLAFACYSLLFSQTTVISEAPPSDGGTSANRAPNGTSAHTYMRACVLVLQSELTSIPANSLITSFGFTMNSGTSSNATTGNFTLYLQNTSDLTNSKGTTFTTAITGMTSVYASTMTIPVSATTTSVMVTLSSPFTYTGGGIYVAYDWASAGPFDLTSAIYRCNYLGLTGGTSSGASSSAAPNTLGSSNFRPCFLWGTPNPYTNDVQVLGVEAPGKTNVNLNSPHTIKAAIRNSGGSAQSNIVVNLNVSGANSFANTQTITSLAPGAFTTVAFAAFNPQVTGLNTLSVSTVSDQNNANNSSTFSQSVTCNQWAQNPAAGNYTYAVGFGNSDGILATPYLNPVASSLSGIRASISSDAASIGNNVYAVLLNSSGSIVATTNTISISTTSAFMTFSFSTAQSLSANTTYYLGLAQTANASTAYSPAGALPATYLPANLYYTTLIGGGTLSPLTTNFGYFGIEAVFNFTTVAVTSSSTSVSCGSSATLLATSPTNYSWSTGSTNSSIIVTPTLSTNYTVSATNAIGCTASAVVNISVTPLVLNVVSTAPSLICGSTATLTASGSTSYTWSSGVNTASAIISPTNSAVYTVSTSNTAGCTATNSISIPVSPIPVGAVSSKTLSCAGDLITFTASGATSYTWSTTSNTMTGANISDSPTALTVYNVSGADPNGCSSGTSIAVFVNALPTLTITNTTFTVCSLKTVTLNAIGNSTSYSWDNGATTHSTTVTPLQTATYSVTGTGSFNCSTTKTIQLTVLSFTPGISSSSTAICEGDEVVIMTTGGTASSYTWSYGTMASPNITLSPSQTSGYTVTAIGANGCKGTNTITVTVNTLPVVMAAAQRTVMCKGETNTITATGATTYSWNAGSTGNEAIVTPTTNGSVTYSLIGTNAAGCTNTTQIVLLVKSCTGVNELSVKNANITVFPNPGYGLLTVEFENEPVAATIEVVNTLGSVVKKQSVDSKSTQLNIQEQAPGIYFVRVIGGSSTLQVTRIIKQ